MAPGAPTSALPGAQAVTVFAFRDARGDEGDGHPNRVGGIYGGYGNQLSKVWTRRHRQAVGGRRNARGAKGDLAARPLGVRRRWCLTSVDDLQRIMNVQRVITDPDIAARLTGGKRPQ